MFLFFKFYFRQSLTVAQADLALMYIQAGLKHVAVLSLLSARITGMSCLAVTYFILKAAFQK